MENFLFVIFTKFIKIFEHRNNELQTYIVFTLHILCGDVYHVNVFFNTHNCYIAALQSPQWAE